MTMKKIALLFGLLFASSAYAADNAVVVTPGTGVTMRSKDIGGLVQSMIHIVGDTAGNPIYGTAGVPNANILTVQGIASMTPFLTTTTLTGTLPAFAATPTFNLGTLNGAAIAASQGTTADAPCTLPASTTACSQIATEKAIANAVNSPIPSGPNTIGNVGTDPSSGKGTPSSVAINISTATTTQLIAASGSTVIYVTSYDVIAGGTGNITLQSADTGGACANPVALTGPYNLTAQAGIAKGNGGAMVLKTPAGKALCALTSAAVQMSGSVSYQQF